MPIGKKLGAALLLALTIFLYDGMLASANDPPKPNYIRIPKISLESPVVSVVSQVITMNDGRRYRDWPVSNDYVSWHSATVGNTVLNGHSDIYGQVFRDLYLLSVGDDIYIDSSGKVLRYRISSIVEVQEVGVSLAQRVENGRYIAKKTDNRLTLVTCSRPGATHRLLIIAYAI